jgi:hypothetical protein
MRSAVEYAVQRREQLDAMKRRLEVFRHRQLNHDQYKILLRFLRRDYEIGLASLLAAEARLTAPAGITQAPVHELA